MGDELKHILHNVDIVISIYKLLNREDQFRLARVNTELKAVFERYIFPQESYSTLKVSQNLDYFVVANESEQNRVAFKAEELHEFVHYHKDQVHKLFRLNKTHLISDIRIFPNLTELHYRFITISREHLKMLGELKVTCPKLKLIEFDNCRDENLKNIMLANVWNTKYLLALKNLKSLIVTSIDFIQPWNAMNFRDFYELVLELELEYLHLGACFLQCDNENSEIMTTYAFEDIQLKELNVGLKFESISNASSYFNIFKNLQSLTFSIRNGLVSDILLRHLKQACINLTRLHIQKSVFKNIKSFVIPSKVTELSLSECEGLAKANLRQILTNEKLAIFFSATSYYGKGTLKDFTISPNLRELYFLDRTYIQSFKLAFGGSLNLKRLSWEINAKEEDSLYDDKALQNCTNLQELNLLEGFLSLTTLSQFKSLQKLTIRIAYKLANVWSYITTMLQHPSLTEIILKSSPNSSNSPSDLPLTGFQTNLTKLEVSHQLFAMALDFWLDFYNRNKNLELVVFGFQSNRTGFMRTLINHEKFPRDLDTLDVCCFRISKLLCN